MLTYSVENVNSNLPDRDERRACMPPGIDTGMKEVYNCRDGGAHPSLRTCGADSDRRERKHMKLSKEFIAHNTGRESILVPTGAAGFFGLAKGNDTFGEILALLECETTEEELVEKLFDKYDAPREKIAADVHRAVTELRSIGAVID